jgi:hypothetical protein
LPKALQNVPALRFGLALYFNAFWELDTERDRLDLQSIKRSSVFQYAVDYEFDDWQSDDLWFYIQHMDLASLKWQAEANKRNTPPPEGASNG